MNPLLAVKLIGSLLLCVLLAGGGFYAGYHWESGKVVKLEAAQQVFAANAKEKAEQLQSAQRTITAIANSTAATAQTKVITRTKTIIRRIPYHVKDNVACVSYGFIRVLNGAAGPRAYPVPGAAVKPDGSCSPVAWSQLAADIVEDYGRADQNAVELSGLQDWVKQQAATSPPDKQ